MEAGVKSGLSKLEKITQKKPSQETEKGQRNKGQTESAPAGDKSGKFTIKQ